MEAKSRATSASPVALNSSRSIRSRRNRASVRTEKYGSRCANDSQSIDDDRIADVGHRVEPRDVVVTQPHAAVRDRLPELLGLLRAVDGVAVAEVQAIV